MPLTAEQYDVLRKPLNRTRVAHRQGGRKQLSYLEAWDVRAHLIRVFGYGNFDIETLEQGYIGQREYLTTDEEPKPMIEVIWFAKVQLTVRTFAIDGFAERLCRYTETAVGSTSGPASMLGEHHDNAVKTAASDALKRCAINLGTQFGLSLYDDGSTADVVKGTLVKPEGVQEAAGGDLSPEASQALRDTLGATTVREEPAQPASDPIGDPGGTTDMEGAVVIRTPSDAAKVAEQLRGAANADA